VLWTGTGTFELTSFTALTVTGPFGNLSKEDKGMLTFVDLTLLDRLAEGCCLAFCPFLEVAVLPVSIEQLPGGSFAGVGS
jgi:hypothetical protein